MAKKISGVLTALVTPFDSNMKVDFKSLERMVRYQTSKGVKGFVVNGTTAESPTLEEAEVKDIWQAVKSYVSDDTVLILGTGSNSTAKTVKDTQKAKDWKADAALVVVPYYNKPPQRGLFQHFKTVAEETGQPILLYNVPGRTITSLSVETTVELSYVKNIIGIKDATGDMDIAQSIQTKVNKDFVLLSGDDGTYASYLKAKGHGIISVGSHIIPDVFVKITELSVAGKFDESLKLQNDYKDLIDSLYVEANPIPVKKALHLLHQINSAILRLPLLEAQASTEERLKIEMRKKDLPQ